MSARFRVGSAVAQACQSMGYRDSIGYQTFLYSSETDIRKIFMFLIEKLPRKEGVKEDEGASLIFIMLDLFSYTNAVITRFVLIQHMKFIYVLVRSAKILSTLLTKKRKKNFPFSKI